MTPHLPSSAALAAAASIALLAPTPSQAVFITVTDMLAAQWQLTVFADHAQTVDSLAIRTNPGDPADSEWINTVTLRASSGPYVAPDRYFNIFTAAAWNPATDGAIDSMRIGFDLRGVEKTGLAGDNTAGYARAVIEQGGAFYAQAVVSVGAPVGAPDQYVEWLLDDSTILPPFCVA